MGTKRSSVQCPSTSTCNTTTGRCNALGCNDDEDCPPVDTCGPEDSGGTCNPGNNECYAAKHIEIWDPECMTWTTLGEQTDARLYHSGAVLLYDGAVLSASGGHANVAFPAMHDYYTAEVFRPDYGPSEDPAPQFSLPAGVGTNWLGVEEPLPPLLPVGGTLDVTLLQRNPMPTRATLVRLGAATHGYDMDQRFIDLGPPEAMGVSDLVTIQGPPTRNHAPPGYYMLFLMDADGNLFDAVTDDDRAGRYVRVAGSEEDDDEPPEGYTWVCPTSADFDAYQIVCDAEPTGGECALADQVTVPLSAPEVEGPTGPIEGFHVVVTDRWLVDPVHPSERQEKILLNMCRSACAQWYAGQPGVVAECEAVDAFDPPEVLTTGGHQALDWVSPSLQDAHDVFSSNSLGCSVGKDCHERFDEDLARAVPRRWSPAASMVGHGEEWRVSLGSTSKIEVTTDVDTYSSPLSGTVGYSLCEPGAGSGTCPFYLGSFEAEATSSMQVSMTCLDQTSAQVSVSDLTIALGQPAFGIAKDGSDEKGFSPGALVMETSLEVDSTPFTARMANRKRVTDLEVAAFVPGGPPPVFSGSFEVLLLLPCNDSIAAATVEVTLARGSTLDSPPSIAIDIPSQVACGVSTPLDETSSDPDSDLESVTWLVDGVPLDESLTHLTFTETHELAAVARDARGATTTARKTVSCGQCEGTATACGAYFGNPSACNAQPGCSATFVPPSYWVCSGARTCEQLDVSDCGVAHGCNWQVY